MELKTLKEQLGEPLCWSDYLSLPFTHNVSKLFIHTPQMNSLQKLIRVHLCNLFFTLVIMYSGDYRNSKDGKHHKWGDEEGHERC